MLLFNSSFSLFWNLCERSLFIWSPLWLRVIYIITDRSSFNALWEYICKYAAITYTFLSWMNIHILMVGTVTNAAAVSILIYASQCHVKTFLWWNAIGVKLLGHRLWISSSLLSATTLIFPSPWSNFVFPVALDESLLFCILSYFAVFSFLKLAHLLALFLL